MGISLLKALLIAWAAVTSIMVVLLIYRSTLGAHEEEQLFLGEKGNLLEREQQEVIKKERRLTPFLYALGTASVVLLLSVVGVWLWRGLLMT
jgi:hypothetical protein